MKNTYGNNPNRPSKEMLHKLAIEILSAYNLTREGNKKDAWAWSVKTIYTRYKSSINRFNLNRQSFSRIIAPICHQIQPKRKKVVDIITQGAEERQQEWLKENALLCRDEQGDPIHA